MQRRSFLTGGALPSRHYSELPPPPDVEKPLAIPAAAGSLCAELSSIEWSVNSRGAVIIEPKEKIKQRTGKSPDNADALALTYATYSRPVRCRYTVPEPCEETEWCTIDNPAIWTPVGRLLR